MRYLGVQGTGLGTFLVNWYGGVVVAALLVVLTAADPAHAPAKLPRRALPRLFGLSLVALVAMSAAYEAYRLAPQTVVQPLCLPRPSLGSTCSWNGRHWIAPNASILRWGSLGASWWP